MMDRQPVLIGGRLMLRPLASNDWDALYSVASDPELWAAHPSHNRWQEPVFREFFEDALARGGALALTLKNTGEMVGSSRFQDYRPAGADGSGSQVEIGWSFLRRDLWGQGYNREFKTLMLEYGFRHVERVVFRVGAENAISRKAMANIGGQLTGETFVAERAGRAMEHVVYEITRESFENGPLSKMAGG